MSPRDRPIRSLGLAGLFCLALLAGCVGPLSNLPRTDQPIFLPALGATLTPTLTPTPSPSDYIQTGPPVTLTQARFAFSPVTGWDASGEPLTLVVSGDHARLSNAEETLYFNIGSEAAPITPAQASAQTCLDRVVTRMRQDMPDLSISGGQPRLIAGQPGLLTLLKGNLADQKLAGSLSVALTQERCFTLLSLATGPDAEALFIRIGQAIDQSLVNNLTWLDPSAQPATCAISTDPSYGLDPNNPIRVGNLVIYDGKQREELYLSTLRGPKGEEILFNRLAPRFNDAEEVIDVYEVRTNAAMEPIEVYFDTATYVEPLALAGYTCESAFPIQAP